MSPRTGRPTDNPKTNRIEFRLSDDTMNDLSECAELLNTTRTDVVERGIKMVKEELKK